MKRFTLNPSVWAVLLLAVGCSSSAEEPSNAGSSAAGGTAGIAGGGAGMAGSAGNAGGGTAGSGSVGGFAGASGAGAGAGIGGAGGAGLGGTTGSGGWSGGAPGTTVSDDPTAARTWPSSYGQAMISLWHDDTIGALTLTVDDNSAPDHPWWLAQGQAHNLKVTWFVITNKVVGNYGGTWPGFANLVKAGHDVQSHTVSHLNDGLTLDDEYKLSQQDIEKNLPGVRAITLAYPGGTHPISNDPKVAAKYYIGARGTVGQDNKIGSTNYMMINSLSGKIILDPTHNAGLPNIVVKNPARAKSFRGWYCVHYHQMTDAVKTDALAGFSFIDAHQQDLWVGLFREVSLYGQERDAATLTVPHVSADTIAVEVKDSLPDALFDFPLTVKVALDASWSKASASQNGKGVNVKIVQHGGKPFALVDAVPDRGPVILSRQ
ncbi:MAG: polysaccharide deacetylase family protein [Polyangiaceae bacterium]